LRFALVIRSFIYFGARPGNFNLFRLRGLRVYLVFFVFFAAAVYAKLLHGQHILRLMFNFSVILSVDLLGMASQHGFLCWLQKRMAAGLRIAAASVLLLAIAASVPFLIRGMLDGKFRARFV